MTPFEIKTTAQLRLILSVLPTLIAALPRQYCEALLEGLEDVELEYQPESLAQECDELRQTLAAKVRQLVDTIDRSASPPP